MEVVALLMRVRCCLVVSDGFLEQGINIEFCIIRRIITRDETWLFQYDPEIKRQNLQGNSQHPYDPRKLAC